MLNYIWAFMILVGIIYGAFAGNMAEVTNAAIDSASEAVSLCITMIGVMALWVGLMEIAGQSGLIAKLTKKIQPFISFLFPGIPKEHPAREYIAANFIANILGLGWAATPAGIKAMEALADLQEERRSADGPFQNERRGGGTLPPGTASSEMCTFLIMNISSLQLIPVNMIAYRSQYGSVNPAAIVGPGIAATFCSTLAAVIYCKCKDYRSRRRGKVRADFPAYSQTRRLRSQEE
jgi:spore maturation protein A